MISDIWIVGNSIVYWAGQWAESLGRQNLRLETHGLISIGMVNVA